MKIAILVTALAFLTLGSIGCSSTAKGVQRDAHKDVEWVGHRF